MTDGAAAAPRRDRWLAVALTAIVLAPIVVAATRALVDGWRPVSDQAQFAVRVHDVFSRHPPLLGTASSASSDAAAKYNHPGALQMYVDAVPMRVFGPGPGLVLAAALTNAVGALTSLHAARAAAARAGLLVGALVTANLTWAMGSDMLWDVWPPFNPVLPFTGAVVATWAVVAGRRHWLLAVIPLSAFAAQSHLTYLFLGTAATLAAATAVALDARRSRPARRTLLAGAALAVVCWLPPLWEQLFGAGPGNLTRLARSPGTDPSLGLAGAVRLVATQVAGRPWFTRDGFALLPFGLHPGSNDTPALAGTLGLPLAVVVIAAIVAAAAALVVLGRRRGDRAAWAAGIVVAGLVAVGLLTASLLRFSTFGIASHHMRFLAGTVAGGAVPLVVGGWRLAGPAWRARLRPFAVGLAMAVTAAFTVAGLWPFHRAQAATRETNRVVDELWAQLADAEVPEPVVLDERYFFFGERYTWSVVLELVRHGVDVRVEEPYAIAQVGEFRADRGESVARILVGQGEHAVAGPPRSQVLAFVDGFPPDEAARLAALEALPAAERTVDEQAELDRLRSRWRDLTVAVYLLPIDA